MASIISLLSHAMRDLIPQTLLGAFRVVTSHLFHFWCGGGLGLKACVGASDPGFLPLELIPVFNPSRKSRWFLVFIFSPICGEKTNTRAFRPLPTLPNPRRVVESDWTCSHEIERSECRCSFHFIFIRSVLNKLVTLVVVPRRLPLCRLSVGWVVQTYQSRHGLHFS